MFLYLLLIAPLELIMDLVLKKSYIAFLSYGVAIIILSLVVNIILLPLYNLAEVWQNSERSIQAKMKSEVDFVKENFIKQERMMMMNFIYKLHKYHPIMAVRTSFGFLIQVPFFFSAYHLLSHYTALNGVSFMIFKDLAKPDNLISIANFHINVMPILMTVINIASAYIYTKNLGKKDKIQLWVLSILFLVLLYNSPVALVLYWTLNNIFSLGKNIVYNMLDQYRSRKQNTQGKISSPVNTQVHLKGKKGERLLDYISENFIYSNLFLAISFSLLVLFFALSYTIFTVTTATPKYVSNYNSIILILSVFFVCGLGQFLFNFKKNTTCIVLAILNFIIIVLLFIHVYLLFYGVGNINAYRRDILGIELIFNIINGLWLVRAYGIMVDKDSVHKDNIHKDNIHKESVHKYFSLFLLSLLSLSSILFWYFPFSLMSNDKTAFDLQPDAVMNTTLPIAGVIVFILLMIYNILPKKILKTFSLFCFGFLFSALVYAFVFKGDYGLMTGFAFNDTNKLFAKITILKDILLLSGFFLLALIIARSKYLTSLKTVVALLFIVSVGAGLYYKVNITNFNKLRTVKNNMVISKNLMGSPSMNTTSFSKDKKNVVVFMTDGFTNEFVSQMIKEDFNYLNSYTGFTLYSNSISVGAGTYAGLYGIVGGLKYTPYIQNKERKGTILGNFVLSYKRLLKIFKDNDYNTSLVRPQMLAYAGKNCYSYKDLIDNCIEDWSNANADYTPYWKKISPQAVELLKNKRTSNPLKVAWVSIFKIAPYYIRPYIYNGGNWLTSNKDYSYIFHKLNFVASLPYISDTNSKQATFKFYQTTLTHPPYAYNSSTCLPDTFNNQTLYTPNSSITNNAHYTSGKCTIRYISKFIDWLKANDIYDNTKIVLVADHSFGDSKLETKVYPIQAFRKFYSLLMVKDFNENNKKIIINKDILTSNADTPAIACENLKGCESTYGKNVLKHPIKNRELHFIETNLSRLYSNYYSIHLHLKVKNSVLDPKNMTVVEK